MSYISYQNLFPTTKTIKQMNNLAISFLSDPLFKIMTKAIVPSMHRRPLPNKGVIAPCKPDPRFFISPPNSQCPIVSRCFDTTAPNLDRAPVMPYILVSEKEVWEQKTQKKVKRN